MSHLNKNGDLSKKDKVIFYKNSNVSLIIDKEHVRGTPFFCPVCNSLFESKVSIEEYSRSGHCFNCELNKKGEK